MIRDFLWFPRFRWFPIVLQNLPTKIDCFWCLENNSAGLNIHSDKPLSTSKTSVQALRLAKLKGLSRLSKIEFWSTKGVHYIILTFTFKNRYKKLLLHSLITFLLMDTQFLSTLMISKEHVMNMQSGGISMNWFTNLSF